MIRGLTEQYPELTTYFEAEVIGEHHPFVTGKWESTTEIDLKHWQKFKGFAAFEDRFSRKTFAMPPDSPYVFMRWKEQFVVPDHTLTEVSGASFDGYYYCCANRETGTIRGFYYHAKFDWFQELHLKLENKQQFGIYEFR